MSQEADRRVTPMRPRLEELHADIRRIAGEDHYVYFSNHANDRMGQRGISRLDAVRVLARGHIDGEVEPGNNPGEWKCKVTANLRGSREIGVVTLVINRERILVKTAEWEDLR